MTDKDLAEKVELLTQQRDMAISMLAQWCVAIEWNGTGWDDWDEYYKDARYNPGPLRELLDDAIIKESERYDC